MNLYPMKFLPRLIRKMWGGQKLAELFNKPLPAGRPIGESWELFDFPPGTTGPDAIQPTDDPNGWISATVCNGPLAGKTLHQVLESHRAELLGASQAVETPRGAQFPLLIKFLDAREDLSVQVHPSLEYAAAHPEAHLKNEAWHILHAEPGARLLLGLRPGVTRQRFEHALADGTAESLMNRVPVTPGETYYMPSGTVHALGAGIVAYEVQTPSDTTFRVFDFNRIDPATGRPRSLHVREALQCIQFGLDPPSHRTAPAEGNLLLARAPQWVLVQHDLPAGALRRLLHPGGPVVATCVRGVGVASSGGHAETFGRGETLLLPPSSETRLLAKENSRLLLAAVPPVDETQLLPR
ncbi:MAG: class I mannose-6-phosphate isomerase [Phycisphaerae bacterium]|nr:class I mannose-6-phosphate isomerase [Phycisphaerae bacterium]MDW8262730.1 class I mannose-6-phosphate isomerase [Phycisphaerales bacterium]